MMSETPQWHYNRTIDLLKKDPSMHADDIFDWMEDITDEQEDAILTAMDHWSDHQKEKS